VTLGSTHDDDNSFSESTTFTWSARKMIKLSKRKYKIMGTGSICSNIGKYKTMWAGSICNNIKKYKMFNFGSASFAWNARKMINHVEGSTNV
jgi:hypothetical protein